MSTERQDIANKIIEAVKESPGLTGRQISTRIGIDKTFVNSVLYGELKRILHQDKSYKWWPRQTIADTAPRPTIAQNNMTTRLCRYYLECLAKDNSAEISLFAQSNFRPQYVELETLPIGGESDNGSFQIPEKVSLFLQSLRADRNRLVPYLGYPVRIRSHQTERWQGFFVEPVFVFPLDPGQSNLDISSELPFINFSVLRRLGFVGSGTLVEEAISLTEELGLSDANNQISELDELFLRLKACRPAWDWKEEIDPYHLTSGNEISEINESGIYNRAIVFGGERSQYTIGLESELTKLQNVSDNDLKKTVLYSWVQNNVAKSSNIDNQTVLEPVPLNNEQRQAVLQGLNNQLTVVTGPPGTGKSQVVTALIVNAAWQGKTILFASKNHKAVDVVEDRTNKFASHPILLRLGNNEYLGELRNHLQAMLSATSTVDDETNYKHYLGIHKEILDQFQLVQQNIAKVVELRNEVDRLHRELESLETVFPELDLRNHEPERVNECERAEDTLSSAVHAASRDNQGILVRLLWRFIKKGRYAKLKKMSDLIDRVRIELKIEPPQAPEGDGDIGEWQEFLEKLNTRIAAIRSAQQYYTSLNQLSQITPLEDHSKRLSELQAKLAANSASLWGLWMRLKPAGFSRQDRDNLSEFCSLIQMIVAARDENRNLGGHIFRNYYRLFPKVANQLPCWAVASLGISSKVPFQPAFFDLVVIDEASQCDIASAIPLLYRAKQAIIIGDPMQLKHITPLTRQQDIGLLAKHELTEGFAKWAYATNSLFDLARSLCNTGDVVNLRDHHRSHRDIIEFSNRTFYCGYLRIATKYDRLVRPPNETSAVRWINCSGRVIRPSDGGAINEKEAQAVVRELSRLVLEQNYKGTIGVVTPFKLHARKIRDLVMADERLFSALSMRNWLVETAYKFQGDERDLMIFSPVVSEGIDDRAILFLKKNGYLFNVAITRARASLIVVGDKDKARTSGIEYLSGFADYVDALTVEKQEPEEQGLVLTSNYPPVARPELVSEWERHFYRAMYNAGIRPIPQYEEDQYILDFALLNGHRKLNIEIDGEQFHRNWDGELCRRDQIRNQRLIELGWDVMRFWVYQVRDNLPWCIERVKQWQTRR